MASLEIPKWIGPVLTPIVLIILILIVCCYYCYWKPRRQRKKKENKAKNTQEREKMVVHSKSLDCSSGNIKHCVKDSLVDEQIYYGRGYYDCDSYSYFGPYSMDYCSLPHSGLSYCVNYEYKPKFNYCPNASSRHDKSRETIESRCIDKTRKCKVKCPRGECIKCPDLPIIIEGDSTLSLCEEKEKNEEEDPIHLDDEELKEVIVEDVEKKEVKSEDDGDDISKGCGDSGYEDQ